MEELTEEELIELDELYSDVIENDIFYSAEEYDETIETHLDAMEEGGVIEI